MIWVQKELWAHLRVLPSAALGDKFIRSWTAPKSGQRLAGNTIRVHNTPAVQAPTLCSSGGDFADSEEKSHLKRGALHAAEKEMQ